MTENNYKGWLCSEHCIKDYNAKFELLYTEDDVIYTEASVGEMCIECGKLCEETFPIIKKEFSLNDETICIVGMRLLPNPYAKHPCYLEPKFVNNVLQKLDIKEHDELSWRKEESEVSAKIYDMFRCLSKEKREQLFMALKYEL